MNKKGSSILKIIFFVIGSLIVGAIVIASFSGITHRLLNNVVEQISAKDIGLTIMTVSASPNDIVYRYDKNTEDFEIKITQDEVFVKSIEGSGKYKFIKMNGVVVEEALLQNVLTIPLILKGGKLSFEDSSQTFSDECSVIPSNFEKDKLKVKMVLVAESGDAYDKLTETKEFIKMQTSRSNSKLEIVDYGEDLRVEIKTSYLSGPEISYYENIKDESYSWYYRTACYLGKQIASEGLFDNANLKSSSEKSIVIDLGNNADFIAKSGADPQMTLKLAWEIYDAIELSLE